MNNRPSSAATCHSAEQLQQGKDERQQAPDEIAQSSLALLCQLQASLLASQQALLAGDAAALELATDEQRRLQQALAILWPSLVKPQVNFSLGAKGAGSLAAEFRTAQTRVLQSGRILAGLLVRAERFRRALANLHLAAEPTYGPLRSSFSIDTSPASSRAQEGDSCRA